jgi:hypothetical protein
MMLHCFESGRTIRRPRVGMPALWSVGAHGALALSVLAPALLVPSDDEAPSRVRETVFLLPMLPTAPEPGGAGLGAPLPFVGPGFTPPGEQPGDAPPAGGDRAAGRAVASRDAAATAAALPDSAFQSGSFIFTEAELDEPVERDPMSAGPTYPEELRSSASRGR